jgi:hypothetical protein
VGRAIEREKLDQKILTSTYTDLAKAVDPPSMHTLRIKKIAFSF